MPKLRQTSLRSQTSSTMTVPISPYTSHHNHQFFSAIYPYKPAQDLFTINQLSVYCPSSSVAFFSLFSGGICGAIHPALRQSSTALLGWNTESCRLLVFFSFVTTVHGRSGRILHVNLSSAARLFVFLYCILERSFDKHVLSTTFGTYTSHTGTHTHSHSHSYIYAKGSL
jgi:hypothetical protein